ncbi:hypothetical protein Salmuc_04664 [Salipiger mucosus DSM 16094]|uniref:Uncharacterized protein n=1 Tax=Salipiger mucosus DSM 16094 TaxID=1123237 RepID=S9QAW1_9RHOB|nr:hypothetical protein Salmuc_04664 [Salipiger mucosus DSM 16094]
MQEDTPRIETFVVREQEYVRGDILYYLCVSTEDPEDRFRISSDYLNDDGRIYLPGSRADNMLAFWDLETAQRVLDELTPKPKPRTALVPFQEPERRVCPMAG